MMGQRSAIAVGLLGGMLTLATAAEAQIAFRAASSAGNSSKSITFVAASTGQTITNTTTPIAVPMPAGTAVGDFAILFIVGRPPDTTEPAAPTGWTLRGSTLREIGANDLKIIMFYRFLTGSGDTPSVTLPASWAGGSNTGMAAQIAVWRGVDPTTPFDVADVTGGGPAPGGSFDFIPPSITTATDQAWVVSFVGVSDDVALCGNPPPSACATLQGFTVRIGGPTFDNSINGDQSVGVADRMQTPPGTPTMMTWRQTTSQASDPWASITFALRPGDSLTINKPTGTVQNDQMIASIAVRPNTIGITPPAGWTLVRRMDNAASNANSLAVYRKTAGASEPASYTWTLSGAHAGATGGIQTFAGVDTTTPVDVENGQSTASSLNHLTPSVTTTVPYAMLVTSYGIANPGPNQWTPISTMTEAFDAFGASVGEAIAGYYVLQAGAGSTGNKQADASAASGPDAGNAHILALRPYDTCAAIPDSPYVAATAPSGTNSVTVYWTSGNSPLILRKTAAFGSEAPTNGQSYAASGSIGAATVVYDGAASIAGVTCSAGACTNTGLTNGTTYYYKVFPRTGNCYAAGTGAEVGATPQAGPQPAWSYTLAGGPMLKAGIAGTGTVHTASNASSILSINTTDGSQTWAPVATTQPIQSWLTWLPVSTSASWYNASWTARKRIRIDKTKVGSGGVTDFPVLVSLTDNGLKTKAQATGNDILFTSSDGTTKLSHEIEKYTSSTGELIAWVKVPTISSSADTDLYMYYGNAAAANQQNATGVWSNGYVGVWHLKEDPAGTAPQMKDSTSSAGHGTTQNMTSADRVPGRIGDALRFISGSSGSGSLVNTGDRAALQLSTYSWSMWLKGNAGPWCNPLATGNEQPLWNADAQFNFSWGHTGCAFNKAAGHQESGTLVWKSAQIQSLLAGGIWYHIATTYDGTNLRIYLNGTLEQTTATGAPVTAAGSFAIGNGVGFTSFAGQLDEVRVGGVNRLAAWIQTEYNNQSSPGTFYSVGAENATSAVIGGDQSGQVYSVDVGSWDTNWAVDLSANADFLQATSAAQLRVYANAAFQATYSDDVIFVASRNAGNTNCGTSTSNNKVFALRASDGTVLWTFNGACTNQVDWIVGMPSVDYGRNRLYVTSRAGGAGTQTSLWVIDTLTGALVTPPAPLTLGHLDASPTLSADGSTIYAGSWNGTNGTLYAVNANTLAIKWNLALGTAGNFKGFLWEDPSILGRLYFSNGSDVRCVQDSGASGSTCGGWTPPTVAGASTLLLLDKIYVGSSDGKLYQVNPTNGAVEKVFPAATTLDGTQVGDVSTETGAEVFVGTAAGRLYKIPLPLP